MIEYAVPGEPHQKLPEGVPDWSTGPSTYSVLPWRCPVCDQLIAESVLTTYFEAEVRTVVMGFSPVHQAAADDGTVPFFGPAARVMRGKGPRRAPVRLRREALLRSMASRPIADADHSRIKARVFDTVCDNCPRRLRIKLPAL